jgi:hypothetical protein
MSAAHSNNLDLSAARGCNSESIERIRRISKGRLATDISLEDRVDDVRNLIGASCRLIIPALPAKRSRALAFSQARGGNIRFATDASVGQEKKESNDQH